MGSEVEARQQAQSGRQQSGKRQSVGSPRSKCTHPQGTKKGDRAR